MWFTTLNIKNRPYVRSSKVRLCLVRALNAKPETDVFFFQEVGNSARYRNIFEEVFEGQGYDWHFFPGGLIICWRKGMLKDVHPWQVKAHEGRKRVSPARWVVGIDATYAWLTIECTFWDSHAVSGWRKFWLPTSRWRRDRWGEWAHVLREVIEDKIRADRQVVGGADTNRSRFPFLGHNLCGLRVDYTPNPRAKNSPNTHGFSQYDYIVSVGEGANLIDARTEVVGGFTDHKAVRARVAFE